MRTALIIVALLVVMSTSAVPLAGKSYGITIRFSEERIVTDSVSVGAGFDGDHILDPKAGYQISLHDRQDKILASHRFSRSRGMEIIAAGGTPVGYRYGSEEKRLETLPFFTEGATITIRDPQGAVLRSIDVSSFATCDQNGKCECRETNSICPSDCAAGQSGRIAKQLQGATLTDAEKKQDCGQHLCKEGYEFRGGGCVELGCDTDPSSVLITAQGFLTQFCMVDPACVVSCKHNAVFTQTLKTQRSLLIESIFSRSSSMILSKEGRVLIR